MKRVVACLIGVIASEASAADFPTTGLLYNQQEDASLTYSCSVQTGLRMRCDFVQTAVRKKAEPADLDKKLSEARKNYPSAVKEFTDPKQCSMVSAWLSMATGQTSFDTALAADPGLATDPDKFKEGMRKLQEEATTEPDVLDGMRAIVTMCGDPTEENFLKITQAEHSKETKTCTVSSNPFAQEFVWVPDNGNSGAWVVDGHPEGPCGVVQLSRFEKDQSQSSGLFWRYIARKAATNSSGTLIPGFSCSSVDQGEYTYDWKRTRSDRLQCEFVEFSPI